MKENRDAWLNLLFSDEVEGGWSDRDPAADPGGKTNHGITIGCYSDWLNRPATETELRALTPEKCREIAVTMFWFPVNADKLPGGIDLLAADFAFHSHWTRAAKELQELVGVNPDGFVGDLTLTAVRKRQPAELMEEYVDAREAFLEDLKNWPQNARGWKKRLRLMKALARTKLSASPGLDEAKGSSIIKGAVAGTSLTGLTLGGVVAEYGPQLLKWLQNFSSDPTAIDKLQTGVHYINSVPAVIPILSGVIGVMGLGYAAIGWKRFKMFRKGKT
jgi:lysozyme family protein